jgi:hypothetical protein
MGHGVYRKHQDVNRDHWEITQFMPKHTQGTPDRTDTAAATARTDQQQRGTPRNPRNPRGNPGCRTTTGNLGDTTNAKGHHKHTRGHDGPPQAQPPTPRCKTTRRAPGGNSGGRGQFRGQFRHD